MVKKLICVSRGLLAVLVLGPVLMRYEKALWKMCICKEAFLWNINNKKKKDYTKYPLAFGFMTIIIAQC
jgi:hypothetical protein